jgi:subtilisin-like proprotein convertase family protein/C1A family cysteine protease
MKTLRRLTRFWLPCLLAAGLLACSSPNDDQPTADPNDTDVALQSEESLLGGTPTNDELPADGKFDAVYPAKFDLKATQSPVRNQASRGVCSIFATIALMEHLYLKEGSLPNPDFSEQFLQWSAKVEVGSFPHDGGSSAESNLRAINRFGIVTETDWPYETRPWTASNDASCVGEAQPTICYTNGNPPTTAMTAPRFKLPAGRYVNSTPRSIKAFLTENQQGVVAGMTFFYQSWNHRGSPLVVNSDYFSEGYVLYPNTDDQTKSLEKRAGHAIMILGWDDDLEVTRLDKDGKPMVDGNGLPIKEKGFFLFKNSWGTSGFGIRNPFGAGYGWLSMKYVEEYASVYGAGLPTVTLTETCDDGLDNDYDGLVDCADPDCASHPACLGSGLKFSSTTAQAVPDNSATGVSSVITVGQPGTAATVNVTLDITHTYIGDLLVALVSPDGTRVVLHDKAGGSADNLKKTYTPAGFVGKVITGNWTLQVSDTASSDTGTLNAWSIEFTLSGDVPAEVCNDQIDNDGNGLTDCADPACAADPACQGAQSVDLTNETPVAIPDDDLTGITSTINVPNAGQVSSLSVDVNITHSFRPDLIVKLRHPGGQEVTLFNQEMDGEQNLIRSFTVTDFNAAVSNGTWTLVVIDGATQDVGTLNSWALHLEVVP